MKKPWLVAAVGILSSIVLLRLFTKLTSAQEASSDYEITGESDGVDWSFVVELLDADGTVIARGVQGRTGISGDANALAQALVDLINDGLVADVGFTHADVAAISAVNLGGGRFRIAEEHANGAATLRLYVGPRSGRAGDLIQEEGWTFNPTIRLVGAMRRHRGAARGSRDAAGGRGLLVAAVAAGAVALGGAAWYARRRVIR